VGVELVRAIASFITRKLKELSSPESLLEMRTAFVQALNACTEKLTDITDSLKDQLSSTFQTVTAQFKGSSTADPAVTRPRVLHKQLEALVDADRRSLPGAAGQADAADRVMG
jgi:hypothetical protein